MVMLCSSKRDSTQYKNIVVIEKQGGNREQTNTLFLTFSFFVINTCYKKYIKSASAHILGQIEQFHKKINMSSLPITFIRS